MVLNSPCRKCLPAILLILLAGIIVYANTMHVPFILDDHLWITQNEFLKNLSYFSSHYSCSNPRLVGLFTLALNFHFGEYNVIGYHVVNLIVHLFTGVLVYTLLCLTFKTPYFQVRLEETGAAEKGFSPAPQPLSFSFRPSFFIPLFAALFFVVHPVQTQAVTYIVQRITSMAAMFYLLSAVLYVQARLFAKNSECRSQNVEVRLEKPSLIKRRAIIWLLLAGSTLAAGLAMKTKEIAFTLPFIIVLYEILFFQGPWRRRLLFLLPLLATLPIVPLSVFANAQSVGQTVSADPTVGLSIGNPLPDVLEQLRANTNMARLDYFFTQFRVIVTYLRLLVLPVNQNLDYDYPVYHTFFTPQVYLSFTLLISLFGLAIWLILKTKIKNTKSAIGRTNPLLRLVAFGILWFFLTLSVESSIVPILDVIMEHRLYLPSAGAAIAFSTVFSLLSEKFLRKPVWLPLLAGLIIVTALSVATFKRNIVWGSAVGLWEDVLSKSPQKPKALNNLGSALIKAGRPWEAIPILKRAVDISYKYDMASYNLGRAYLLIGQSSTAITLLRNAIRFNPDLYAAYSDLGAALIKEKRYGEAIALLEQNLNTPLGDMPEVLFNLGVAYYNAGNPGKARQQLALLSSLDQRLASKLADYLR